MAQLPNLVASHHHYHQHHHPLRRRGKLSAASTALCLLAAFIFCIHLFLFNHRLFSPLSTVTPASPWLRVSVRHSARREQPPSPPIHLGVGGDGILVPCLRPPCEAGVLPLLSVTLQGSSAALQAPEELARHLSRAPQAADILLSKHSPLQDPTLHVTQSLEMIGQEDTLESITPPCAELMALHPPLHAQHLKHKRLVGTQVQMPYVLCAERPTKEPDFAIVTHTDLQLPYTAINGEPSPLGSSGLRVLRVLRLATRWNGVIVVGARLLWANSSSTDASILPSPKTRLADQRVQLHRMLKAHLLENLGDHPSYLSAYDFHLLSYPGTYSQNAGRNMALRSVRTKYVLVIDADFVPPLWTYERLNSQYRDALCAKPRALVLPHFDVFDQPATDRHHHKNRAFVLSGSEPSPDYLYGICSQKSGVQAGFAAGNITNFHEYNVPHTWCADSMHWMQTDRPYRIFQAGKKCPQMWEPILAYHINPLLPYFPEVFAGRGFDRISQVMELRWLSYDFIVDHKLFMCHPAERHNYTVVIVAVAAPF